MTPAPEPNDQPESDAPAEKPRRFRRAFARIGRALRTFPVRAIAAHMLLGSPFFALGAGVWLQFTLGWGLIAASMAFLVVAQMPDRGVAKK